MKRLGQLLPLITVVIWLLLGMGFASKGPGGGAALACGVVVGAALRKFVESLRAKRVQSLVAALTKISQFLYNPDGSLMSDEDACTEHVVIARKALKEFEESNT